ncbi:MAG TPA: hypothetical protein VMB18_09105 [Terriglobales bacterium]|nr:hypothetical protein [Terriglobales bacterium]
MQARGAVDQRKRSPSLPASGWTSLGPAPLASNAGGTGEQDYGWVSGRATAVAIDPADPTANTVYVGGAYGGVWKSTNALSSSPASVVWTPLTDTQATLAVGAIAIQPQLSNPDPSASVILVGTGEANSSTDSYYGLGILRSANAGTTWTLISSDATGTRPFAGMAFSRMAFSTINPNLAVAATAGASEGIIEGLASSLTANLGLYYSTDGGMTWNFASVQDGSTSTAPGSATGVVYNAVAGQFFAALRYHGFYSSSDGMHWNRLLNQPGSGLTTAACPAQTGSTTCPIYRGELAVVPGRNEMYVWYVDAGDNDQGVWESTNGGASWSSISDIGIAQCGDNDGCGTEQGTYNLELAAVPDGGATDLYAGSVNLYKCQITVAAPNCSGTAPDTFLNLTHAYGCSSIAMVHPAQHALAFLLTNNNQQDPMYFANDGGVYRTLDGYSGLTDGACDGGSNQFDSLNQTLGSMTQVVSFSEPPDDPNTILGGTQGNGAAATQSALAGSSWLAVFPGDTGYNQIDPDNVDDWFVSSPPDELSGVNIFGCASGFNCTTQEFQGDQVVSSSTVGGDTGSFYPAFMLDPQNSSEMLVGTCRMWRGSSSGTGFGLLSNNFETGGSGTCTGSETNLVTAMAAGGPLDQNGFSNVIYAGTDGFGPLIPTIPPGGHVWVSTSVAGGPPTWIDQTGSINPNSYPISGIAIDNSDSTGQTAYVGIMGFHVSHLWKTTNGGASWTDFTANLPDAPVDAVLVDSGLNPATGTVYVGTEVGVFSSSTATPNWTEVGPAAGGGLPGYLPNVAVTALRMYNDGTNKWLRASTYGRGIWQFSLLTTTDYVFDISNTPQTVFAESLPAVFNGTIYSLDGYNSSVQLSCQNGVTAPPPTCTVNPSSIIPTSNGAPFTVTTGGPDGTYTFDLHGVGGDPQGIQHDSSITLNVVDFGLSAPSPSSVTIGPGQVSKAIQFQVTAEGPFNQTVNLFCSGLPTGAACTFQPSSAVNPGSGQPVNVTLTISAASNTPAGTFPVGIQGSVTGGPTKSQSVSLTVTLDYSLAIGNSPLSAYQNAFAIFNGTLTSLNGYNSPVNLSCGNGAPPTCTVSPATVTPTAAGAPFTVTVSSTQCGQYNFNINAVGTDPSGVSHSTAVQFNSNSLAPPNYTLEVGNSPLTATVNAPAIFNGMLYATACYSSAVMLSCGSGAPPKCAASPAALVPTSNGAPFTVTVSSGSVATYNFNISGQGTDPSQIQHTALASFTTTAASAFDFSITNVSGPESVVAGSTATFTLQLAPTGGSFPENVALSYSACPPLSTCGLSQTQVNAGKGATTLTFTVQTAAPIVASNRRIRIVAALWTLWPGVIIMVGARSGRRHKRCVLLTLVCLLSLLCLTVSCGSGLQGGSTAAAEPGTPPGVYGVTVSAAMNSAPGSPTESTYLTLTVTAN